MELLDKNFVKDLKADGEPRVSAVRNFSSAHWGSSFLELTGKPKSEVIW